MGTVLEKKFKNLTVFYRVFLRISLYRFCTFPVHLSDMSVRFPGGESSLFWLKQIVPHGKSCKDAGALIIFPCLS